MNNELSLPPYVVNEVGPAMPQSQTMDWGMNVLKIPEIRTRYGLTGKGIKVAIIDTGIDPDHEDLKGSVVKLVNTTGESFSSANGHGTACAGIIAARDNQNGVVGVAPNCEIIAIKGMRESGGGVFSELVKAVDVAISSRVDIINLSMGSATNVVAFQNAIARAVNAGIIVVCAAGNAGRDNSVTIPARYGNTIGVGATNQSGRVSAFSSRGWEVDIAAPGELVLTTWKNNGYAKLSGTSFAAPYVTGVIALLLEAGVAVSSSLLKETAIDIEEPGEDVKSGHGILNGLKILETHKPTDPSDPRPPIDGLADVKNALQLLQKFIEKNG
jgi:subtilisin family serine protease